MVENLQAQTVGPKAIDPQPSASCEVADEELLLSLGPERGTFSRPTTSPSGPTSPARLRSL